MLGKGKKIDRSIKRGMQWLLRSVENNFEALDQRVKKDISVQKDREKQEKKAKAERVRKIREERYRTCIKFSGANFLLFYSCFTIFF